MKKIKFLSMIALAGTFFIASCGSDEELLPVEMAHEYAIIKGAAKANLNLTNDTNATTFEDYENAPTKVVIYAKLNSSDLITNPSSANYADKIYKGVISSDGSYEVIVPARHKTVNVTIYADDFIETQTVSTSPSVTNRRTYDLTPVTVAVEREKVTVVDLYFN
jgi:hypothetical protein